MRNEAIKLHEEISIPQFSSLAFVSPLLRCDIWQNRPWLYLFFAFPSLFVRQLGSLFF